MGERVGRGIHRLCIGRRARYLKRSRGTSHIASAAIRQDILLSPALAVAEDDRHLDHAEAGPHRAVGQLDLEGIAPRADAVEVDRLEHLAAEALEAAGQVAHAQAEHPARVGRAALADEAPQETPVAHAAAGHVARAQRQVGAAVDRLQQAGEVAGSWEKSESISITYPAPWSSA